MVQFTRQAPGKGTILELRSQSSFLYQRNRKEHLSAVVSAVLYELHLPKQPQ